MNKSLRIFTILATLFSITALIPSPAIAKPFGADRAFCATCCQQSSPDGTSLTMPCPEIAVGSSFVSHTEGLFGDTYPVVNTPSANGEGLELSLHYASHNANGDPSLDTVMGFGWSHSNNIFLFTQDRDVFKMSPGGIVTKYQRSGRSGALTAITGTQQTVIQKTDGSIEITNRHGGTTYRFEKIPGNPLRVAAVEPLMLTAIIDRNRNVTQLTYENGLLKLVTDVYNRQIKFDYDASHHLTRITDPLERVTQLVYEGYSNLTKVIDPLEFTVQYAYDVRHQIVRKTDKNGNQWRYSYNAAGHPIAVVDQAGNPVLSLANSSDWATNATDLAVLKLRTYLPSVTTRTDGLGNKWQYFYNTDGQITQTVAPAPDNATTTYTYDPATLNMASVTDANVHTTRYEYDGIGNLRKQIDAKGNEIRYEYSNPYNFVTKMSYFASGASTPHSVTNYDYDAAGNRIRETRDAGSGKLNITTDWTYFGASELPGNPSPAGGLVKTAEKTNVTPSGSVIQITRYEYDNYGNLKQSTDPEIHVTRHESDIIGNRTCTIDGNGHYTFYQNDALNRLVRETVKIGTQECTQADADDIITGDYQYDGSGNRIQLSRQTNTLVPRTWEITQYQYDLRNRLAQEIRDPADLKLTTAYGYDNNDNRTKVTDPRGKATDFVYDVQNRLSKVTDALTNITLYAYDPAGNRIQETDANGHKSCSQYDALNRLTVQIRKMGATSCALTASTDIVTRTFFDTGEVIACDHDPGSPSCNGPTPGSSNIAYTIDPEGKYSYFKYDKVDRRWITIRKVADTADTCDGDDWCEFIKYDDASNVNARIDANGNRTNYTYYDNNWLKTETTDPGGLNLTTTTTYDGAGNPKTITNPRGNIVTNSYDERNQLVMVVDSIGKVAEYKYDGIGNRTVERDGNQGDTNLLTNDIAPETRYTYDAVNRLIEVTDPMGNSTANGYDKNGNLIKVTDREDHVTCHYYDNINRRTRTTKLMGGSNCAVLPASALWTDTEYDAVGNVRRLITAKKNSTPAACAGASQPVDCETTHYQYDPADRLVLETYADGTTRQFSYDQAGNLTDRVDQLGQVTQYDYNDLYYLLKRDYQDAAEADDFFEYDTGGRMTRAERADWVVTFDDYDAANRLLQTTQDATGALMTVRYAYNTAAGTHDVNYPGLRVCNEQRDLRDRLKDNTCDSFNAVFAYDLGNRVETRTYNNNVIANYSYDADNRITSLTHTNGGTVADFGYAYDKEGNKQYENKAHDPSKSQAYAYDEVYRLIDYKVGNLVGSSVPVPSTQTQYNLDKVGNWDQFTKDNDGAGPRVPIVYQNTVNQMNEYDDPSTNGPGEIPDDLGIPNNFKDLAATPTPDGENWAHDKNGNRREDGKRIYLYDDENRLIQVTRKADNVVSEYKYDALSRRVVKTDGVGSLSPVTTRYAYDDARIIEEQKGTALTLATYVYGNYIDEVLNMQRGGVNYYYHQNALWSVVAVTNAAAGVVEQYAYSDYGCPSVIHSAIGNPWMFTGRQWDEESGLYYYRARYYDCEAGRFLQRDVLGYRDGFSLYEYTKSNPVIFGDPLGLLTSQKCMEGIAGELGLGGSWPEDLKDIKKDNCYNISKYRDKFPKDSDKISGSSDAAKLLRYVVYNDKDKEPCLKEICCECDCKKEEREEQAFSRGSRSITIYYCDKPEHKDQRPWKAVTHMVHELVHASDFCKGNFSNSGCRNCLLREIRAYKQEGACTHEGNCFKSAVGSCLKDVSNSGIIYPFHCKKEEIEKLQHDYDEQTALFKEATKTPIEGL